MTKQLTLIDDEIDFILGILDVIICDDMKFSDAYKRDCEYIRGIIKDKIKKQNYK